MEVRLSSRVSLTRVDEVPWGVWPVGNGGPGTRGPPPDTRRTPMTEKGVAPITDPETSTLSTPFVRGRRGASVSGRRGRTPDGSSLSHLRPQSLPCVE